MAEALDFLVAQTVQRARLIERALHDNGPWEISYGKISVGACKAVLDDRVVFLARLPETCWLVKPDPVISLLCRGQVVAVKVIEHPGDGAVDIQWEMAITEPSMAP